MELTAQKRTLFGKSAKRLRKNGLIPAELYGHKIKNEHLSVSAKEFEKIFKEAGENTVVNLSFDGEKRPVMIHDVSVNSVTDKTLSIDFYEVNLSEKIEVGVPLEYEGESPAVKEKGGILVKAMHELEIEALPNEIPHSISVNLNSLTDIGSSIYVSNLSIPKGVKVLVDGETVVATITEKEAEEEIIPAPSATVDSVKVETEEKKAERLAKKESETKPE